MNDSPLQPARVAYVMSRFPKLTETFVLSEILGVEAHGLRVSIYPLLRQHDPVVQPAAVPLVERARYEPFLSAPILRANLRALRRDPRRYVGTLLAIARGTLGSRNYFFGGLAIFPKVVRMAERMRAEGIEHVHCHFSSHPALAGFIIHRLSGIPYSFTAHGSDLHVDRHMLCPKVDEAGFVVAISEDNRSVIRATCGDASIDRVRVIHTGVETDAFPLVSRPDDGQLSILAIGTLHEVKGQVHLIDACRRLRDADVPFRCRLVGEGPDRAMLETRIREAGLERHVALLGARTRTEVLALLADSDVLVTPSVPASDGRREGIPVVLMEAMASGLPVVASRLSGIPELVRDGIEGFLVPPRDDEAIAAALERLAGDADLRRGLGRAGRVRVEEAFDAVANAGLVAASITESAIGYRGTGPSGAQPRTREPRRPRTMALVGPDGAGKTTVARHLEQALDGRVAYLYMGVNPDSGNRLLPTTRLLRALRRRGGSGQGPLPAVSRDTMSEPAPPPRGLLGNARSMAGLVNRLAEEWYRQAVAAGHLRAGRAVIYDRHYLTDYHATDIAASNPPLARRLHGLLLRRLYPRPDVVVYLDAPPEVLYARKGEGTIATLARRRDEYLAAGREIPGFTVIDATQPVEAVVEQVGSLLGLGVHPADGHEGAGGTVPSAGFAADGRRADGPERGTDAPGPSAAASPTEPQGAAR